MRQFAIAVAIAATLSACGGDKPEPRTPDVPQEPAAQLTPAQEKAIAHAQEETGDQGLHFDEDIRRLCPGLASPKFDYDSSRVKQQFRDALIGLATCMNEGGLKGKSLLFVGRADPRGEEDYNLALGGRRAASVRDALSSLGVLGSRMDLSSRGELDAEGTNEATWANDRRVDVHLSR